MRDFPGGSIADKPHDRCASAGPTGQRWRAHVVSSALFSRCPWMLGLGRVVRCFVWPKARWGEAKGARQRQKGTVTKHAAWKRTCRWQPTLMIKNRKWDGTEHANACMKTRVQRDQTIKTKTKVQSHEIIHQRHKMMHLNIIKLDPLACKYK